MTAESETYSTIFLVSAGQTVASTRFFAYSSYMTRLTLQADLDTLEMRPHQANLELATLTVYDVPAMAVLQLLAYDEPLTGTAMLQTSEQFRMAFDGAFGTPRDDSFIGAWFKGELIGLIMAVLDPPWDDAPRGPFITELIVDPVYRHRGVATALIGELARRADEWGYDSLTIRLDLRQSPNGVGLYQEMGFSILQENGA